jgi:hypothetical protein
MGVATATKGIDRFSIVSIDVPSLSCNERAAVREQRLHVIVGF